MTFPLEGGCDCRRIRYRMTSKPLFVHCCHCRWCQRETGSAFVLNAMIEADRVERLAGEPMIVDTLRERPGPADLALPALPGGGVELVCRLRTGGVRSSNESKFRPNNRLT